MQTTLKVLGGFWIATTLLACSLYSDVNGDPAKNNKASFQRDGVDCAQSFPESGSKVRVKQRIGCMNLKGWH